MIIYKNKSEIANSLHLYLYGQDAPDAELVEIYEEIDRDADELEEKFVELEDGTEAEKELKEIKMELFRLLKGFKGHNRAEIKEILEGLVF